MHFTRHHSRVRRRRARLDRLVRTLIDQTAAGRVDWTVATTVGTDGIGARYVARLDRYEVRITTAGDRWSMDVGVDGRLCCAARSSSWWLAYSAVVPLVWALTWMALDADAADLTDGQVAA